jgi:hypothetical protein
MNEMKAAVKHELIKTLKFRFEKNPLFCDGRYDEVFVYHNGAESYYAARGFRGLFSV